MVTTEEFYRQSDGKVYPCSRICLCPRGLIIKDQLTHVRHFLLTPWV
jgi:hypothetical protein